MSFRLPRDENNLAAAVRSLGEQSDEEKDFAVPSLLVDRFGDPIRSDNPLSVRVENQKDVQDVQLTGRIVESIDITEDLGEITAGTSKDYELPEEYRGQFAYAVVTFRRSGGSGGSITSLEIMHNSNKVAYSSLSEPMEMLSDGGTSESVNITEKTRLLSDRFRLIFTAGDENDFADPYGVILHLWRR